MSFEVLEEMQTDDPALLIERERFYYDKLSPQYNQMRPDFVPTFNPTPEERLAISKKYSGEGNPFYGKKHTLEAKKKISEKAKERIGDKNPFYGKKHSDESKKKMSKASSVKVIGTDFQGNEFIFNSAKEAGEYCRELGLTKSKTPNSDIIKVCKGKKETAFKFYWRYG